MMKALLDHTMREIGQIETEITKVLNTLIEIQEERPNRFLMELLEQDRAELLQMMVDMHIEKKKLLIQSEITNHKQKTDIL
ncbi:hypothetical protein OIN60_09815 [Paenibacillus sp. P96]|uniref:Uncharacterized protein n=1 Tax=Paenibacillus zeirhizosphaerae TaxID=2987519 RepID=A0ABT9FQR3_9BACL|nr:hypothetical protein [Paenibacillus sp. P96]MDP4097065.1 hypothetical protein [Paenibacillus sp. P96]